MADVTTIRHDVGLRYCAKLIIASIRLRGLCHGIARDNGSSKAKKKVLLIILNITINI